LPHPEFPAHDLAKADEARIDETLEAVTA